MWKRGRPAETYPVGLSSQGECGTKADSHSDRQWRHEETGNIDMIFSFERAYEVGQYGKQRRE